MFGPVLLIVLGALIGFGSFAAAAGNMAKMSGSMFDDTPLRHRDFDTHFRKAHQSFGSGFKNHLLAMVGMSAGGLLSSGGIIWLVVVLVRG